MKLSHFSNTVLKSILIGYFMVVFQIVFAQKYPQQNNPPQIVNDFANALNNDAVLEADLVNFNNTTSNQISIITINSTNGYDIAEYAIGLFNNWEIGQTKKNNGVLILIAIDDRKTFIVTGKGVEEFLPDLLCKRIVEEDMIPQFKNGDYDQGVSNATKTIKGYLDGTFKVEDTDVVSSKSRDISLVDGLLIFLLIVVIIIFILIVKGGGNDDGTTYKRGGYDQGSNWGAGFGGFWGGSSGGFSDGGSSSGGGFGGFGGGSSGGGGAGGNW